MSNSTSNSPSSSNSDDLSPGATAATIALGVVGGIVLIVIAFLILNHLRKSKLQKMHAYMQATSGTSLTPVNSNNLTISINSSIEEKSNTEIATMERFLDDILKEKPLRFTSQHLIDFTDNFAKKLGSGGFGVVYKGGLPNGMLIAVKILHKTSDKRVEEQFMAEVGTIGRTYHINLVRLYGFCYDPAIKALVYEYMVNGSLDQYLFDKNSQLPLEKLYEIALGTAKGIRYLHEECQKKIVHYDIKPGNVLLDENFSPKVADFGLAKLCDRDNSHVTMTGGRGTPGYAAPELWMPFPVTQMCDVYSFGMLLFEILGQRKNLDLLVAESQEWFPRWVWEKYEAGEMDSVMSMCGIVEKDRDKAERMSKVALACVQYRPETRPTMSNAVKMLEGEKEICMDVNPFQYLLPLDAAAASGVSSGSTRANATSLGEMGPSLETLVNGFSISLCCRKLILLLKQKLTKKTQIKEEFSAWFYKECHPH